MTNTQLLRDLIRHAQAAGDAIRSTQYDVAEDSINDVLLIARMLADPQLCRGAQYARESFRQGFVGVTDRTLRNLIINANSLVGSI